ncbi:IS3 family transposase [Corynebacterium glutamicum]|uniref:IS3 family transposase n=2 Tax=Corynebacterium glutamicum TaxID=1718 RepID=UPI001C93CFF4|nr:IS3 family transposase [Corynebacterium glutamicum]
MSRASYYRWAKPAGLTPTAIRHSELRAEVAQEFENSNQMAGRDQLTTLLNQRGGNVSTGTVGAIMNELGLRARRMRTWKNTTVNDPAARTEHIKNHMIDSHGKRDFIATVPGTRLVGDIMGVNVPKSHDIWGTFVLKFVPLKWSEARVNITPYAEENHDQ